MIILLYSKLGINAQLFANNLECPQQAQEARLLADLATNPAQVDAHYNLGLFYRNKAEWALAFRHFNQALTLDPTDAEAHYQVGYLHRATNQLENARFHLERAVQLAPKWGGAWYELGCVYADLADFGQAVRCLERAMAAYDLTDPVEAERWAYAKYYIAVLELGGAGFERRAAGIENAPVNPALVAELQGHLLRLRQMSE